uniref:Uncharacterized protein n=1 Tax=Clandestinovirus TaxID=2831644 RepID=A0A8F8KQR9_9VIRU|nr:hypothetical protein KOM_12_32 [Clandestinovirus]
MTTLPTEIIAIVIKKKQDEEHRIKMRVFGDFIIPWIHNFRDLHTKVNSDDDPDEQVLECGNLRACDWAFISSFHLTALKRVCRELRREVDYGRGYGGDYSTYEYYQHKDDPF